MARLRQFQPKPASSTIGAPGTPHKNVKQTPRVLGKAKAPKATQGPKYIQQPSRRKAK